MKTAETKSSPGFTLIELLIVIGVISLLTTIVMPSLSMAKDLARGTICMSNLHGLGTSGSMYLSDNNHYYWPYALANWPTSGVRCYWWGTDADPVDPKASPFMKYGGVSLESLGCPNMPWGSYIPQGAYVSEPTTTYGYNGFYLDSTLNGKSCKNATTITRPSELFVLNDSGMRWRLAGKWLFQNSTYLEPVTGNYVQQPTSCFRHQERTHALLADGHAAAFGPEGGSFESTYYLGFVGTTNEPHYAQD